MSLNSAQQLRLHMTREEVRKKLDTMRFTHNGVNFDVSYRSDQIFFLYNY